MNKITKILIFIIVFTLAISSTIVRTSKKDTRDKSVNMEITETEQNIVDLLPENTTITLSFVGDLMLASYKNEFTENNFRHYSEMKSPEYFLSEVVHIFEQDDFTIGNLENVLSDNDLLPKEKDHNPAFWFKAKTTNTDILTSSSIECVSLENNHTNDYGTQGFKDTIEAVEKAGINYGTDTKTMYLEKDDFKIAVICCGLWSKWQTTQIIERVKEAEEKTDYQIIYFHGGTERLHKPEEWKIQSCHKIAENGADLIIGGHPHVLQPKEIYNNVEIIYSLGNFCYGGNRYPENRTIIYQVKLEITPKKEIVNFESKIIPCYVYTGDINNYQPDIIEDDDEKEKVLKFMNMERDLPY